MDRFLRERQAPAEINCGEEGKCRELEPKTTEATEATKKEETRGQNILTGVEENICHDFRGSSLPRLNKKCFVPPAGNFLPYLIRTVHFRLSLKQGTGNGGTGNGERGTGNGESLKGGISKRGNL